MRNILNYIIYITLAAAFGITCGNEIPYFDGQNAYEFLTAQTDFGPRNPGSEGARLCCDYLIAELLKTADQVTKQPFTLMDTRLDTSYNLMNIIASYNLSPPDGQRILLMAHWDTRHIADHDPEPENRSQPILGANDGASGVAVLLQIGQILKENPPPIGVDVVLFDGEDYGTEGDNEYWCNGSKYFAENIGSYRPVYAVLLDMIGDSDLRILKEGNSLQYAEKFTNKIWKKALKLKLPAFVDEIGPTVYDDHIPVNRAGIPAVDIIDFEYPYWHTIDDTPDKCSPQSLAQVGTLILALIYE